jgi:hypothetical protein
MCQLKLYVTLDVPEAFFEEGFHINRDYIREMLTELAEGLEGSVTDLEIK